MREGSYPTAVFWKIRCYVRFMIGLSISRTAIAEIVFQTLLAWFPSCDLIIPPPIQSSPQGFVIVFYQTKLIRYLLV